MTRWVEDASMQAPEGHVWLRPALDDCPDCPCHTARVCEGLLWYRSDPPCSTDGMPYVEECPCEAAAPQPETREIVISFNGDSRTVSALYHHHGFMQGHLEVINFPFRAVSDDGTAIGRCGLVLRQALPVTDPALVVVDSRGERWQRCDQASVGGRPAHIVGWWSD